jgi:hypothetical protein
MSRITPGNRFVFHVVWGLYMVGLRNRGFFILFVALSFVLFSFSPFAHAGCRVGESCSYKISGRLTVKIDVRDVSGTVPPTSFDATLSFEDRFITVSIGGLKPGLYTAKIRSARGTAFISSGDDKQLERIALSHRAPVGKTPSVALIDDGRPRPMGSQGSVEVVIGILTDRVFPMTTTP